MNSTKLFEFFSQRLKIILNRDYSEITSQTQYVSSVLKTH